MSRAKKFVLVCVVLVFIPLTFLKVTTARIRYPQDNTEWLVKPDKFIVSNHKIMKWTNDEIETDMMHKGKWYYEQEYKVITVLHTDLAVWVYDILIVLWWIILACLIMSFVKGKKYMQKI